MVNILGRAETLAKMERGFYPRNIVVIGAARHNRHRWLKSYLPFHQNHGKVFHVNVNEDEWPGATELRTENFHSILDRKNWKSFRSVSSYRNRAEIT